MGRVHKLNEINELTQLHTISHKTVEIIKMKMFVAEPSSSTLYLSTYVLKYNL